MKRFAACFAVLCFAAVPFAQTAPQSPELQRLNAFVGNWNFVGEAKAGPMGPGGKITGISRIAWLPGGTQLERQYEGKGPTGEMKGKEILGYDAAKKIYTFSYSDSSGMKGSGTTTVKGNVWTATGMGEMAGMKFHERCTLTFGAGNTTLNVKCEGSADGKTFMPTFEGTGTKIK